MSSSRISKETAEHVARLSRLALSEAELGELAGDLARVLDYVDQLQKVDVEGVPPTMHVLDAALVCRDDIPGGELTHEQALKPAPRTEDGLFAVPKVIES